MELFMANKCKYYILAVINLRIILPLTLFSAIFK
jgi:hypothetical protein